MGLLFPKRNDRPKIIKTEIGDIRNNIERLLGFADEREVIRRRRAKGQPAPWTDDPILQEWSFCNVRREHDRGTRWYATNWREPHADDPDLGFATVVYQFINWPNTAAELGYPVPWNAREFLDVMADRKARKARGDKIKTYGDAYMIRADAQHGRETPIYQVEAIFNPLWDARLRLRPRAGDRLQDYLERLAPFHGLGRGFMTGQVIADMKYVEPLSSARDWASFCVPGPGSDRGLNRVLGRPVKASWQEAEWRAEMRQLHEEIRPDLREIVKGGLYGQDLNNLLCEFDKYERVRLGEGKPKRRFVPHTD